jgi:hypothetical protein
MINIKKFLPILISCQLLISSLSSAAEVIKTEPARAELSMQEITLPSEVKDLGKQSGSIFYNTSVKNKVLVPTHFWGEVGKPGLHFIPTDTSLIKGLSMAGGPTGTARIDDVVLNRFGNDGKLKQYQFNLSEGGTPEAYQFKLEQGDSVFIKKDTYREDRSYYTGLIGIAISIISTLVLLQGIKRI